MDMLRWAFDQTTDRGPLVQDALRAGGLIDSAEKEHVLEAPVCL